MTATGAMLALGMFGGAFLVSEDRAADARPLWGHLKPGPHSVGFKSLWQLDYSRVYQTVYDDKTTYAAGKAPRPILVNLWYPALPSNGDRLMPHGDYLRIETNDPRLSRFASKLAEYERGIVCHELWEKSAAQLTEAERRLFAQYMETPTACRRDAPAVDARFPLVIYHSGADASFEDNAVFCEYLASHGYFVVGSAFQDATGQTLAVDERAGSARDFEFLIAYARRLANVDWNHIGLAGHSLGAQAVLKFRAQDASPVDAVVSLDTLQDYLSLASLGWEDMIKPVTENARNITGGLLMAANAHAFFELADSLEHAERIYLTLTNQHHNDFIGQGIERQALACAMNPGDRDLEKALDRARSGYEAICDCALEFFNVYLKGQTGRRDEILKRYGQFAPGKGQPHVEYLPPGVKGAEPFRDDGKLPPTPRQVRPLLAAQGVNATLALFEQWHKKDPDLPIFNVRFGLSLVEEWLARGRVQEAIAFYRVYCAWSPEFAGILIGKGDSFRRHGAKGRALHYYRQALLLDPANEHAAERIKELKDSVKE